MTGQPDSTYHRGMTQNKEHRNPRIAELIDCLQLEPHVEGGFFHRSFRADHRPPVVTEAGGRVLMSAIYYLLTRLSPVGHFHRNISDIVHFFHEGDPVTYYLIDPDGELRTCVMGPDVAAGQHLQLVVRGGVWKASRLPEAGTQGYALIGEAVAPGFEYEDMMIGTRQDLQQQFPQHAALIEGLCHHHRPD